MQWCTSWMWQPLQGWGYRHPGLLRLEYQGGLAGLMPSSLATGKETDVLSASWLCPVSAVVCWSHFHSSWCYILFLQPHQSSCLIYTAGRLPGQGTGIFLAQIRALSSDDTKFHSVNLVEIAWFCPSLESQEQLGILGCL